MHGNGISRAGALALGNRDPAVAGVRITVTGTPEQSALINCAQDLLTYARNQGYKPDELIHIIQQLA